MLKRCLRVAGRVRAETALDTPGWLLDVTSGSALGSQRRPVVCPSVGRHSHRPTR